MMIGLPYDAQEACLAMDIEGCKSCAAVCKHMNRLWKNAIISVLTLLLDSKFDPAIITEDDVEYSDYYWNKIRQIVRVRQGSDNRSSTHLYEVQTRLLLRFHNGVSAWELAKICFRNLKQISETDFGKLPCANAVVESQK